MITALYTSLLGTRPVPGSVMRSRADRLVRARVPLHSSSPRPASWSAPSVLSVPILFRREETLNQHIYYCVALNPHIHISSVAPQISPAIDPPSTIASLHAWITTTGNQLSDRRECGSLSIESIVSFQVPVQWRCHCADSVSYLSSISAISSWPPPANPRWTIPVARRGRRK